MKNTKELYSILTAIQCINQTNGHRDEDIANLLKYTSIYITNSNYNMLTLSCIGRTKEEIMPELNKLLGEETKYLKFLERMKKNDRFNYRRHEYRNIEFH